MRPLWQCAGALLLLAGAWGCAEVSELHEYSLGQGSGDGSADPDSASTGDDGGNAGLVDGSEGGTEASASDARTDAGQADAHPCPDTAPTSCGGACVDEQTDVAHCGGCGSTFACATGQACVAGRCLGCATICPLSAASTIACAAGGCNAAGGTCTAEGQGCYCTSDGQCKSGACVRTAGHNDVSCGSSCTGTGSADGFDCAIAAPGIPATCAGPSFGYSPSNFAPASYAPPATSTTIDCSTAYSSTSHAFTGWCSGQTAPTIYPNVAQPGGHAVDLLAFAGLTLDAGSTLTLTGSNPVILAVYGGATISGVIDASAQGATPGAGAAACAVGAGGGGASGAPYTAGITTGAAGGGGGGFAAAGANGDFSLYGGVDGGPTTGTDSAASSGGAPHGSSVIVPLSGGCQGGTGAGGTAGNGGGAGGAGGGGVQISASGTISGSGTVKANGVTGTVGTSESPATPSTDGAAGGGGGSGGSILIESSGPNSLTLQANGGAGGAGGSGYGVDTTSSNTWSGFAGGSGGTSGGGSATAPANGGPPTERGKSYTGGGGGGGGAYGWIKINTGPAPLGACMTTLSPPPVCTATHACLCAADGDCSSGKCVDATGQCTGTCSGSGIGDATSCQDLASAATAWSCSVGTCSTVAASGGACASAGIACWCTADSQCSTGHCAPWVACPAGACSGSGTPDGMHCVP